MRDNAPGNPRRPPHWVFAGLIYLRGNAQRTALDMTLTGASGARLAGTSHQTLVWNVEQDDAGQALDEAAADFERCWGLLFWAPLMRGASRPENIARWLLLMQRVTSKRHRADLGRIALVFAELAGAPREWREALKEIEMQESQFMIEWTKEAREEERVQTRREDLLRLAKSRFKGELTEEDKQMISTQESALVLSSWLDAVVGSESYADFRTALRS